MPRRSFLLTTTATATRTSRCGSLRVECPETARDYNVTDVKIYLNQGNGRLVEAEGAGLTLHENRVVEPHTGWGTDNSEATTQAWGDYTGDGAVDLAVGYGNGRLRLFRNQNNGSFVEDSQSTLVIKPAEYRNWPSSLHFADFNNDGHLDLLVSMQHCTSAVSGSNPDGLFTATQVWINDGTGNFTTRNDIVCAFTQSAVVGDLNSDGLPDLVFLNYITKLLDLLQALLDQKRGSKHFSTTRPSPAHRSCSIRTCQAKEEPAWMWLTWTVMETWICGSGQPSLSQHSI